MKKCAFIALAVFMTFSHASSIKAQDVPFAPSNEPLEITADGSLEWKRAEQIFIARENALAVQGDVSVAAQTLTAHYRQGSDKNADSGLDIYEVEAETNVKLVNETSTAYGDHATYNLDKGLAIMTGDNLRLVSPDQTITAQERFEYWVTSGKAIAKGRPRVTRPKIGGGADTLDANELTATFTKNQKGEQVIDTLEAAGNVVITTPTEIIKGAHGLYKGATNKAELTGGVTITRGPNVLEGARAVVDMTTNTSQIFGSPNTGGRVKGVFYPGSEKKDEQPSAPQATPPAIDTAPALDPAPAFEQAPALEAPTSQPEEPAVEIGPLPEPAPEPLPQPEIPLETAPQDISPESGDPTPQRSWAPLTRP